MPSLDLDAARRLASGLFDALFEQTRDDPGVTRVTYGDGEQAAFALVAEAAMAFGAEQTFDAAGNQFLTLAGRDRSKRIVVGSHLDSVPHGGNFDGAAGVIMGVAAQKALAEAGVVPAYDVTVACLRAEESCWFPHSYIGSKTALGRLEEGIVDGVRRSDSGETLAHHIDALGFDAEGVRNGASWLTPETVVAYIEPHIEQAPALIDAGLPLAAVSGIRGSFRFREMVCRGEYSHSGAMPRHLRRDAAVASARLVVGMQGLWERMEADGEDLTVTFGQIGTDPANHSFSKVAGEVRLCLDVRSQNEATLARVEQELQTLCATIGQETGTRFDLGPRSRSKPAIMAPHLVALVNDACRAKNLPVHTMPSGAGHDAATFANAGVPSVMIFIRNANGSHNPDEAMEMVDFDAALAALTEMLTAPATAWRSE
ncbi:hydantoinase/carbamoylase family amidase [Amorphus orientalis]|uniref:N-carbamoyl-L-amino-acid hydrolase n=1 Tax=Amorphus orientalis TaxID=649198 RepID=A0AAE3VRZ0_9HYPH|nr:hydantoinase/carbamoylase family amidase [Amorphus orientalis]MDQ0316863.1 N-carbamoyl-L-amino-acid hydrolase [Amorphus orientalis]